MVRRTRKGGFIRNTELTPKMKKYRIIAINSLTDKPIGVKESVEGLEEAKKIADLMAEEKNRRCYVLDDSNRSVYRTED